MAPENPLPFLEAQNSDLNSLNKLIKNSDLIEVSSLLKS